MHALLHGFQGLVQAVGWDFATLDGHVPFLQGIAHAELPGVETELARHDVRVGFHRKGHVGHT